MDKVRAGAIRISQQIQLEINIIIITSGEKPVLSLAILTIKYFDEKYQLDLFGTENNCQGRVIIIETIHLSLSFKLENRKWTYMFDHSIKGLSYYQTVR